MKLLIFFRKFNFTGIPGQVRESLQIIRSTIPFIRQHKLWKGYFDYKWIALLSIGISLLFTYLTYENLTENYIDNLNIPAEYALDAETAETAETVGEIKSEGKRGARTSGTKYILIILLEIIIFYFSVKTLSILTDKDRRPTFKEFMNAEKRMIKIMLLNWVKGLIVGGVLAALLSIIGLSFLSPILMFFVFGYFMGYAFLDNYNEQFKFTIKQSQSIIRQHLGAAITIGILVSLLIYIPIIGPLFGPIFGSVAAAIYCEKFKVELEVDFLIVPAISTSNTTVSDTST